MSDDSKPPVGRIHELIDKFSNGELQGIATENSFGSRDQDNIRRQLGQTIDTAPSKYVPKATGRPPVEAPTTKMPAMKSLVEPVQEAMKEPSAPPSPVDFDDSDYPPPECSFQTSPTEVDDSDAHSESEATEKATPESARMAAIENELQDSRTDRENIQHELREMRARLSAKDDEIDELMEQLKQMNFRHQMTQDRMEDFKAQISTLRRERDAHESQRQELEEELTRKNDRIDQLERQLREAKQKIEAMAEKHRADEILHRQELQQQRLEQLRKESEILEAAKEQTNRNVRQFMEEQSRGGLSQGHRDNLQDDLGDRDPFDGYMLSSEHNRLRSAGSGSDFTRTADRRPYDSLQLARQRSAPSPSSLARSGGLSWRPSEPDLSRPRLMPATDDRPSKSGSKSGKNLKLSRPKRDRTKMSVTR